MMINSNIECKPLCMQDPIDLISIDFTHFIKSNKPILTHFVDHIKGIITIYLAINRFGQIQIIQDSDSLSNANTNEIYGMNIGSQYCINKYSQNIDKQIIDVLSSYQSFLQTNIQEEQKMDFFELSGLDDLSKMFTDKSYIRYVIPRIMTGDMGVLESVPKQVIIANLEYFANMLLIQPKFNKAISILNVRNYCNKIIRQYLQIHGTTTSAISVLKTKIA